MENIIDSQTYYNTYAQQYQEARKSWKLVNDFSEVECILKTVQSVKDKSSNSLLDVGCWYGKHIELYERMGFKVSWVDESSWILSLIWGKKNIYTASSEFLPFSDNNFDVATSSLVFFHIQKLEKSLQEIWRVLRPGGDFIFTDINPEFTEKYGLKSNWDSLLSLVRWLPKIKITNRNISEYRKILEGNWFQLENTKLCFPNKRLQNFRKKAYEILARTPAFILYHAKRE